MSEKDQNGIEKDSQNRMESNGLLPQRIASLASDLNELANILANDMPLYDRPVFTFPDRVSPNQPDVFQIAKRIYSYRRKRVKHFNADIFGEPAWDILLDLFIASETGKCVSITSACIGADVPATTALRWISVLEKKVLIVRKFDWEDKRRVLLSLTYEGKNKMRQFLAAYAEECKHSF